MEREEENKIKKINLELVKFDLKTFKLEVEKAEKKIRYYIRDITSLESETGRPSSIRLLQNMTFLENEKSFLNKNLKEYLLVKKKDNTSLQKIDNQKLEKNLLEQLKKINEILIPNVDLNIGIEKKKVKKLKKNKENKEEEITEKELDYILLNAGNTTSRSKSLKQIQLQLIYLILYYTGLRLNEIYLLNSENFMRIFEEGKLSIPYVFKKTTSIQYIPASTFSNPIIRTRLFSNLGIKRIKKMKQSIEYYFKEINYSYLFTNFRSKNTLLGRTKIISLINADLNIICETLNWKKNLTSKSFRNNYITKTFGDRVLLYEIS
jgi:integrase